MNITYINHSCFLAELEERLLLFDYYSEGLEREGILPGIKELPDKPLYAFVSHKHRDHFDRKLFELEKVHPQVSYILSKDAKMNESYMRRIDIPESAFTKIQYIGKRETRMPEEGMRVTTLASTDAGVAFLIETEGKVMYHAGDLNWWSFSGQTAEEEKSMEKRFKQEIDRLAGISIDVAFLPLDPRQEERFFLGFDYFMKNIDTKLAYPMHFWGDRSVIGRLKEMEISEEYRDRIMEI